MIIVLVVWGLVLGSEVKAVYRHFIINGRHRDSRPFSVPI